MSNRREEAVTYDQYETEREVAELLPCFCGGDDECPKHHTGLWAAYRTDVAAALREREEDRKLAEAIIVELRERIAALEGELNSAVDEQEHLRSEVKAREAENERLRTFARHREGCEPTGYAVCSCGYSQALAGRKP